MEHSDVFNGASTAGLTINLLGSVADGDVLVVAQLGLCDDLAQPTRQARRMVQRDDAVVLRHGTQVVDVIGQIGVDPGTEWGSGLASTADNTLRRGYRLWGYQWHGRVRSGNGAGTASRPIHSADCPPRPTAAAAGRPICPSLTFPTTRAIPALRRIHSRSTSRAAGAGGVTFDIATADDSATVADNDYVSRSLTGQTIPAGSSTYSFDVTVNGDPTFETNDSSSERHQCPGRQRLDSQGVGTITNDDVDCSQPFTPIYNIQGSGLNAAITGSVTAGIVVGDFEGRPPIRASSCRPDRRRG